MRKTLYIDAGNSSMKVAAHDGDEWELIATFSYDRSGLAENLRELCREYSNVAVASVKRSWQPSHFEELLDRDISGITRWDIPSGRIRYRSVESFGIDRFLGCLGAWSLSGTAVIVSDAGTACTIDIMDRDGVFRGGVIMPGIYAMEKALVSGTDGLFQVGSKLPAEWPPQSTETALQAGLSGSYLAAWEMHVRRHRELYPDARLWVTGGDSAFLKQHASFDMHTHSFLVFEGMRKWFSMIP